MIRELSQAVRSLRRGRTFTLLAVACLGLGIGVTTTMFSAVDAVLMRPLPFGDADRVGLIYARHVERGIEGANVSYPDYLSWKAEATAVEGVELFTWLAVTLSGGGEAERVSGAEVTADLFPLLGVAPMLGRGFTAEEEGSDRAEVVLLSHGLWERRYGADREIIGKGIAVDGVEHTVVGVMPRGFRFPSTAEIWVPFEIPTWAAWRGNRGLAAAVVRLGADQSFESAQAQLDVISRRLAEAEPQPNLGWDAELVPLRDDVFGEMEAGVLILFGAVGMVLLIACANVGNLLLARGTARRSETAVRLAIGASRWHVVRELLAESLCLGMAGGAAGVVLAAWSIEAIDTGFADRLPYYARFELDGIVLLFTLAIAIATSLLFGLLPALHATRPDVHALLKDGLRGSAGRSRARTRGALVVAEVALTMVLLVGATLLMRGFATFRSIDTGFDAANVLTLRVHVPPARYADAEARAQFYTTLLERVRALPGVQSAGAAQGIPFSGWNIRASIVIDGTPPRPGQETTTHYQYVTPGFFEALGVPLVSGRGVEPNDRAGARAVGVINQAFADRYLAGRDPIGMRVQLGGPDGGDWTTIVGVTATYRHYDLVEPMGPALYMPYAQSPRAQMDLAIRTAGPPVDVLPQVRGELSALDPHVPMFRVRTLEDVTARELWLQRLQRDVLAIFALLAFLLAIVGVYGVIAYGVAQRRHEIGIRVALGARAADIVRLVLGEGARLAALGGAIGLAGAFVLAKLLTRFLYEVSPADPVAFVAAAAAVGAGALLASVLPARRASKTDPLTALRR